MLLVAGNSATDIQDRLPAMIFHIDVLRMPLPDFASMKQALRFKETMKTTIASTKLRRALALKFIEVQRNELPSIAALEVSYEAGSKHRLIVAARCLG